MNAPVFSSENFVMILVQECCDTDCQSKYREKSSDPTEPYNGDGYPSASISCPGIENSGFLGVTNGLSIFFGNSHQLPLVEVNLKW